MNLTKVICENCKHYVRMKGILPKRDPFLMKCNHTDMKTELDWTCDKFMGHPHCSDPVPPELVD